jgi:4-amino-4-deoxy-L-arabinose transferase-like glycosyltransferase
MRMNITRKKVFFGFIVAFALLYVVLAISKISSPGVHYDELLFVNAALGEDRVDQSFIRQEIAGIPVLLMPYIGALKSYIYYPVFKLFGVSVWTIRLPVILITFFSVILLSGFLNKAFNKEIALIVILLLIIDPSFIYLTRLDVGPNALEFFLKCASLFVIYYYFRIKRKTWILFAGLIILGFGLFNKLNFLWFINSLYGVLILLKLKKIRSILKVNIRKQKSFVLLSVAYVLFAGYFLFIYSYIDSQNTGFINIDKHFLVVFNNIIHLIKGTAFYNYVYGSYEPTFFQTIILYLYALIILSGLAVQLIFKNSVSKSISGNYLAIWLIILLHFIQILLTKKATAPWHVFTLYPFFTILLGYSLYLISIVFQKKSFLRYGIVGLFLLLFIANRVIVLNQSHKQLGQPVKRAAWSEKVYELIDYTRSSDKTFVSIDWGLHNNLIAFDPKKGKYHELIRLWVKKEPDKSWKDMVSKQFFTNPNILYVSHSRESESFSIARKRFKNMAKKQDMRIVTKKIISDNNRKVYEIYALEKIGNIRID